jgi:hypothetical protein
MNFFREGFKGSEARGSIHLCRYLLVMLFAALMSGGCVTAPKVVVGVEAGEQGGGEGFPTGRICPLVIDNARIPTQYSL